MSRIDNLSHCDYDSRMETLGQRIARLRGRRTQEEIAAACGLTRSNVAMWETDARPPRKALMPLLAKALGVSVELLTDGVEQAPVSPVATQPSQPGDEHVNEPAAWSESLPAPATAPEAR